MAIAPGNTNFIYTGGSNYNGSFYVMAVGFSTNGGNTWNHAELTTIEGYVYTLAVHPTNPEIVFAGGFCYNGSAYIGSVFKTTDGGYHWSDVSSGISENYNYVYCIVFDSSSPNTLYAGCNSGIYKSVDEGVSWSKLTTGFRNVYSMAMDPHTSVIYAACYGYGVYRSHDGGNSWSAMNDGLTTYEMECLVLDSVNQLLFVGTRNAGVFRYNISTGIYPITSNTTLPNQLRLLPNYPNPFNPTTTIGYEIPVENDSPVELKIYNISGQIVKTLVDELQPAGKYTVSWDGTDNFERLASTGIYFCILKSGSHNSIQKMMLLR